jgi:hypothetical protein
MEQSTREFSLRLYHGTTDRHLQSILEHGLRPRGELESNWEAASNHEAVYLTKCYALHFAANSRTSVDEKLVIIEIDTDLLPDPSLLLADEDAVTFAWQDGKLPEFDKEKQLLYRPLEEQAAYFARHLKAYAGLGCNADWSLSVLGNCTYHGTIPPEAITRIVSYEGQTGWWFAFHDPLITAANFRFCGTEYEATQLVLAERLDEAKKIKQTFPMMISLDIVEEVCAKHRTDSVDLNEALTKALT